MKKLVCINAPWLKAAYPGYGPDIGEEVHVMGSMTCPTNGLCYYLHEYFEPPLPIVQIAYCYDCFVELDVEEDQMQEARILVAGMIY